jgi:AcrR family transcriptional regulator
VTVTGQEHGRERNKRATRRALRAATLALGLERGLAEVSVEDIARRAGVSTRTFFNYFDAKDDAALIELFLVTDEELTVFASGNGAAGAWADLTRMLTADVARAEVDGDDLHRYLRLHAQDPELAARQMGHFTSFLSRLADAVAARTGGGRPESRLRAEVMAGACVTAVRVGLNQWAAQGRQRAAVSYVHAAFSLFDGAFGDIA